MSRRQSVIAAAVVGALAFTSANAQTRDSATSRIGALTFERGYPTAETAQKLYDEMDFQRATQAYLWAYPAVSFESIRVGLKRDLGIDYNELALGDNFVDTKGVWLTANDTTNYGVINIDLGKGEPAIIEIPPGPIVGLIEDFWQRALADVGLPGPDQGNGGKFLLVPPDYKGELPAEGYYILRSPMNNHNFMVRGLVRNNDVAAAVAVVKKVRVYPWSERANPKALRTVSMSGKAINSLAPAGLEYWERVSAVINNNPVHERDRFFMAMLKPLGIEKGKEFKPDARQRTILEEGARVGEAMARTILFDAEERFSSATAFPGTNWNWVVLMNADQENHEPPYGQLDERLHYMFGAIYMSPAIGRKTPGPGSTYTQAFKDRDGNRLDCGKSYRLRVPANPPVSDFWSLTIYDTATRSMIQNARNDAAVSSYDTLKTNADGSIDLYFGPTSPGAELENNWVQTVSGKGFYPFYRFYGPTAPLYEGTWKLADLELLQ